MEKKEGGYEHTSAWWKPNKEKVSRAPLMNMERRDIVKGEPEKWGMSLLIKILKYSSFDLLEHYEKEWNALDVFTEVRKDVTARDATNRIPQGNADKYFQAIGDVLGELELFDAMQEAENLKSST